MAPLTTGVLASSCRCSPPFLVVLVVVVVPTFSSLSTLATRPSAFLSSSSDDELEFSPLKLVWPAFRETSPCLIARQTGFLFRANFSQRSTAEEAKLGALIRPRIWSDLESIERSERKLRPGDFIVPNSRYIFPWKKLSRKRTFLRRNEFWKRRGTRRRRGAVII